MHYLNPSGNCKYIDISFWLDYIKTIDQRFSFSDAGYKKMVRPNNVDASNPLFFWLCAIGVMFKAHLLHWYIY